jgi:acetyltransferase-like isoleucine patch superfamily enzyme
VIILPGVIIGEQALVAAGSIVAKDIPSNTVAAGIPAKVIRERNSDGKSGEDLDHVWLHNKAFQSE